MFVRVGKGWVGDGMWWQWLAERGRGMRMSCMAVMKR